MAKLGIVCEGGGTRGAYTAGFLTWCLDNNIPIDYINGISAGAVMACLFVSKQPERMKNMVTKYVTDSRYMGVQAFLRERTVFGIDFAFDGVDELEPLDKETLMSNPVTLEYGLYHCETDTLEYFGKDEVINKPDYYKATCRLPGFVKIGEMDGQHYFDGGVKAMIPIARAEEVGIDYNIVVLTKPGNYVRKPEKKWQLAFLKLLYGNKYPKLLECLNRRHIEFAEEIDHIYKRQEEGKGFVVRPSVDMKIDRLCKDVELLTKLWELGYSDGEKYRDEIMALVKRAHGVTNE